MGLFSVFGKKNKGVYGQAVDLACKDLNGRGVENIWRYRDALFAGDYKSKFNDAVKSGASAKEIADHMVMHVLAHRMVKTTSSIEL